MDEKFNKLKKWFIQNGGYINDSIIRKKTEKGYYGLFTTEKLEKDTVIIKTPSNLCLDILDNLKEFFEKEHIIPSNNLIFISSFKIHNNEFKLLRKNLSKNLNAKIFNKDGFEFLNKVNEKKKTLVLIDPSYEIKDDFDKVLNTLKILNAKFENLTAIIWYPVLNIENNDLFIENIRKIGSNRITRIELPVKKYDEEIGMKGSGIILFDGSPYLIKLMKECVKELYHLLKDEYCNIKPKIQKI